MSEPLTNHSTAFVTILGKIERFLWLKTCEHPHPVGSDCFDCKNTGYIFDTEACLLLEDTSKEIANLKEELKREREAVDFYADRRNWGHVCKDELPEFTIQSDLSIDSEKNCGGKLARDTVAKRKVVL